MTGYGSVRTSAHLLGKNKAAELLQNILDEESETLRFSTNWLKAS
jgi:ferritin-like metal-binding protein YciE